MVATASEIPSSVSSEAGEVLVDGPDGLSYAMTPAAAWETGSRLIHYSVRAKAQLSQGTQSDTLDLD